MGSSATFTRPDPQPSSNSREGLLATRVRELEQTLDENDYQSDKKFKEQYRIIAAERSELNSIKSATGQLQTLPEQLSTIGTRVGAAEARAGEGVGQAEAARQTAEGFQKQLTAKLSEVEARAARAAEQVGGRWRPRPRPVRCRAAAPASGSGTPCAAPPDSPCAQRRW